MLEERRILLTCNTTTSKTTDCECACVRVSRRRCCRLFLILKQARKHFFLWKILWDEKKYYERPWVVLWSDNYGGWKLWNLPTQSHSLNHSHTCTFIHRHIYTQTVVQHRKTRARAHTRTHTHTRAFRFLKNVFRFFVLIAGKKMSGLRHRHYWEFEQSLMPWFVGECFFRSRSVRKRRVFTRHVKSDARSHAAGCCTNTARGLPLWGGGEMEGRLKEIARVKAVLNWAEHSVREQLCLLEMFKLAVRFLIDVFDLGEQPCSRPMGRRSDVRNVPIAGYGSMLLISWTLSWWRRRNKKEARL